MIRLVTLQNFPLVDLQIERAYQRRRGGDGVLDAFSAGEVDDDLLWMVREARLRARRRRDWLRELALEIDSLSIKQRKRVAPGPRRRAAVMPMEAARVDRSQRNRKAG